jgi:hypothetical protein
MLNSPQSTDFNSSIGTKLNSPDKTPKMTNRATEPAWTPAMLALPLNEKKDPVPTDDLAIATAARVDILDKQKDFSPADDPAIINAATVKEVTKHKSPETSTNYNYPVTASQPHFSLLQDHCNGQLNMNSTHGSRGSGYCSPPFLYTQIPLSTSPSMVSAPSFGFMSHAMPHLADIGYTLSNALPPMDIPQHWSLSQPRHRYQAVPVFYKAGPGNGRKSWGRRKEQVVNWD